MFLCRKYLLYSTEVLLDIYREYVQQMQGYQWWIYRQDIESWTCRLKFLKSRSNFKVKVHLVKKYGMMWKVLSQGIHLWNMKVLSLVVHNKLWPRLKFVYGRQRHRGYDNSSLDFRHGELKMTKSEKMSKQVVGGAEWL